MSEFKRRDFLKLSTMSAIPLIASSMPSYGFTNDKMLPSKDSEAVYFINDGIFYRPADFIDKIKEINNLNAIERDSYGEGATLEKLLNKFKEITGKESAVYLPTGTLANQLAISVLCGDNTKAFVQETSHVYRDEADAAQTLFNKRLIPLGTGKTFFTLEELQESIKYHKESEVFVGAVGAVSIETPVRRTNNEAVPFSEIKRISAWCKEQGYKLHLDGARLHIATTFTNASVKEYASYFDTVYMCLYKYLGATGGAVLCGDKAIIDKMHHLIKIHGGGIFTNWPSAAMALHHLNDIDEVMTKVIAKTNDFMQQIKQVKGLKFIPFEFGTNQFNVLVDKSIDAVKLNVRLRSEHNIIFGQPHEDGFVKIKVNPTLLRKGNKQICEAFKEATAFAKI